MSISCQADPAWNGSPAWKRIGTTSPSIFLPRRPIRDKSEVDLVVEARAQEKQRLQAGEAAPHDHYPRNRCHRSAPFVARRRGHCRIAVRTALRCARDPQAAAATHTAGKLEQARPTG